MNNQTEAQSAKCIVVGLDASSQSIAALRAASELASLLNVDLEGLFVEDAELAKLCQYPFQHEVRSYTGALRPIDSQALSRQMKATAASLRRSMELEAARRQVHWRFQVRRGSVADELLSASQSAAIMSLGRASRQRRSLGSTVRTVLDRANKPVLILDENGQLSMPFVVLFNGDDESERALRFTAQLVGERKDNLRVLVYSMDVQKKLHEVAQQVDQIAAETGAEVEIYPVNHHELRTVAILETGTLVLPKSKAVMLNDRRGASVVVP